jgi:hypothetical protein
MNDHERDSRDLLILKRRKAGEACASIASDLGLPINTVANTSNRIKADDLAAEPSAAGEYW